MSEALEKVLGIKQLPIFPLPLVVLPFELLPLHIFEPRYKKMFEDIALEKNMFGVSLFEPTESFIEKPEIGTIGCVAEVTETQTLEDGRSNILTVGVIRYHIRSYVETDAPYFIANVDFFEDREEDKESLQEPADRVFSLFKRVAKAAHKISGQEGDFPELPQAEPEQLSFLVSSAFNLDNDLKYQMLEIDSTSERLKRLTDILSQAVKQVEESAEITKVSRTNGHAKKKIDLD